jgi:transposase
MAWTAATRGDYVRASGTYASDVTDLEWALIAPLLPAARRGGRPRSTCLRQVVNAVFYLLQTGCQWRMLPRDFPPRSTVSRLLPRLDRSRGLGACPRRALPAEPRTGGPRREPDRRDHRQPERQNRRGSARDGGLRRWKAGQGPQAPPRHRHTRPRAAHRGPLRRRAGSRRRGAGPRPHHPALPDPRALLRRRRLPRSPRRRGCPAPVEIIKRSDAGFVVQPKRWVVERTFAWACINRRLARDVER